jgi:hypothetical protein
VLFAASLAAWGYLDGLTVENPVAEIYKNGELVRTLDLSDDFNSRGIFTIGTPEIGINTIRAKLQKVWVTESDCPSQFCVNTASIGYDGLGNIRITPIICVPNRLEIRIISGENPHKLDAVAR